MNTNQRLGGTGPVAWVKACCDQVTEDGAMVSRFLVQTKLSPQDRKWANHCGVARLTNDSAEDLAAKISNEVDSSEAKRVRVVAMFPNQKVPCSTRIWETPLAEDDDDTDGLGGTPHDAMAVALGQALRHNEVLLSRMVTMGDQQIRTLTEQNKGLAAQQTQLIKDRLEIAEAQRELIIHSAETEARTERNSALIDGLRLLTQTVAHKVTGGAVASDARFNTLAGMLRTIGDSITPEQADRFAEILDPKQLIALTSALDDPEAKVSQIEEHREKKKADAEG
jgi:hypothetical protein